MARQHKLFQIFRAGRHITMGGQTVEFTEADLETTAKVYSLMLGKAPLVLGHPTNDLPSFGEVTGVFAKGGFLYAQGHVDPELVDLVRKGRYRKISAAFHHPQHPKKPTPGAYALKHVGFLGAAPPSVKGLISPAFADAQSGLCFSEGYTLSSTFEPAQQHDQGRMAMHNLACGYQDVCPELTYAEAIQHVRGVLSF